MAALWGCGAVSCERGTPVSAKVSARSLSIKSSPLRRFTPNRAVNTQGSAPSRHALALELSLAVVVLVCLREIHHHPQLPVQGFDSWSWVGFNEGNGVCG